MVISSLSMDLATIDLSSIVVIILGATGAQISIHRDILCTHCEFAQACLKGGFREARAGQIILAEENDEQSIRTLIAWMYSGRATFPNIPSKAQPTFRNDVKDLLTKMLKLYIMANKYVMTGFQKEIEDFITTICQSYGPKSTSLHLMALGLLCNTYPTECDLKEILISHLVRTIRKNLFYKEKSYFVTHPKSEWCQDFFALTARHPELANLILCGLLQPPTISQLETQAVANGEEQCPQHRFKRRRSD